MLTFWVIDLSFKGWQLNFWAESGIFVKPASYQHIMAGYRDWDMLLIRLRPLAPNRLNYKDNQMHQIRFFIEGKSFSYQDLSAVVESYVDTSTARTATLVLDRNAACQLTHGEFTAICDLLKVKRCKRIIVTSPSFQWVEPPY